MANIAINSIPTRVQYSADTDQTVFSYTFPIKANTDLKVYQRAENSTPNDVDDLLVLTTDYTVSGANTATGGNVTLVVEATKGDIITIVGDKPVDRTAIYDQSVTLTKADLNNDFNNNVMYDKQLETIVNELSPKYARSEKIAPDYRQDKLILPMLNDNEIWVGRGNAGDDPDDIQAVNLDTIISGQLITADVVVGTANVTTPNAQVLGDLNTGLLKNTAAAGTGTLSQAILGTDYYGPGMTTDIPVTEGGTGASTAGGARTNLDAQQTISGLSITNATVANDDKVLIQDTSASDALRYVTALSIAELSGGGGFTYNVITSNTTAALNNGYIVNSNVAEVEVQLPLVLTVGSNVKVLNIGTQNFSILCNTGQTIYFNELSSTTGAGGSLDSIASKTFVELLAISTNEWQVIASTGTLSIN